MLWIVHDSAFASDIRALLQRLGVQTYSEIPKLFGQGVTGVVDGSWICPGHNACTFTVLPEPEADRVAAALREFVHAQGYTKQRCPPVRAYLLPCEEVV